MDKRAERVLRYLAGLADQHDGLVSELKAVGGDPPDEDVIVPLKFCQMAREWRGNLQKSEVK